MPLPLPLLLQTLDAAVKPPIVVPLQKFPPHLQHERAMAELVFTPYRPISEWTGIPREVFPEMTGLSRGECEKVTQPNLRKFLQVGK